MKNSLIKKYSVRKLDAELFTPFTISSGSHKSMTNVLFTLEAAGGVKGYGEAAIATHITGETRERTMRSLEKAGELLSGLDAADYLGALCRLERLLEGNRAALAAAEMAVLDLATRLQGLSLWKFFGGRVPAVKTDVTVVIGGADAAYGFTKKMRARGFRIFKIKTGVDMDEDYRRLEAVRRAAPGCAVYLDANCAYSAGEAEKFIRGLMRRGITPEVVEQPVKRDDIDGLAYLSRRLPMPVCADESAYSLDDVFELIRRGAVTAVNIKLTKLGFLRAREVWALARAKGIKLMMGEMLESELASSAAAQFAAGLGGFDFIDLDTPFFIKGSGLRRPAFLSRDGVYSLDRVRAGIGVEPR
ncbi:MAG: dipeptide epimerase [Elusimicrobia bacterium HGW-Elusimicrobia-3]|nr:MAG: dipeptide epimerase [Elusimicrobia bacterium HGW-Elusimicrobia-3]